MDPPQEPFERRYAINNAHAQHEQLRTGYDKADQCDQRELDPMFGIKD